MKRLLLLAILFNYVTSQSLLDGNERNTGSNVKLRKGPKVGKLKGYKYNQYDGTFLLRIRAKRHLEDFQRKVSDGLYLTPLDYMKRRRPLAKNAKHRINDELLKAAGCRKHMPAPTVVTMSVHIREISRVEDGHITLAMYLRYSWTDYRFQYIKENTIYDYVEVASSVKDDIWLPDVFIPNSVEVTTPVVFVPSTTFRVYTNNTVYANQYLVITLACPFNFAYFPMDVQVCDIPLQSFGFTPCEIDMIWAERRPLTYSKSSLSQFSYKMHRVRPADNPHVFNTASYGDLDRSQLHIHLVLQRRSMFYLMQLYTPSLLFVVVSWISFLIPKEMAQGRMLLTITTMLTMVSLFAAGSEYMPKVSYLKAIDVWMCVCTFLSFSAVVDVLVDLRLEMFKAHNDKRKEFCTYVLSEQARRQTVMQIFSKYVKRRHAEDVMGEDAVAAAEEKQEDPFRGAHTPLFKFLRIIYTMHNYAVVVYPILFALFNLIYWGIMLGWMEDEIKYGHMGELIKD